MRSVGTSEERASRVESCGEGDGGAEEREWSSGKDAMWNILEVGCRRERYLGRTYRERIALARVDERMGGRSTASYNVLAKRRGEGLQTSWTIRLVRHVSSHAPPLDDWATQGRSPADSR